MSASSSSSSLDAASWLKRGQTLEEGGTPHKLAQAVQCYDHAIASLQCHPAADETTVRDLAIAWMNRGNALQKQSDGDNLALAVESYNQAITHFHSLPDTADNSVLNSLGAAWLNRSHALQTDSSQEAIRSCEQAIITLSRLPLETHLAGRLNLAGAHLNLAHLILATETPNRCERAHTAAAAALNLSVEHELKRAGFADIGLKARRVLCEIIGLWLIENNEPTRQQQLIATASDAVDTGLTLARRWDSLEPTPFRPLAERLFRFGTAYYRRHQPHFLADFVLENLDPEHTSDAYQDFPELHQIALEALAATRQDIRTQHPVIEGSDNTERHLQTLAAIDTALRRLDIISSAPTAARSA